MNDAIELYIFATVFSVGWALIGAALSQVYAPAIYLTLPFWVVAVATVLFVAVGLPALLVYAWYDAGTVSKGIDLR